MGIQYNPTVPTTGVAPATQYTTIQSNFASIQTLIDVDHTDFANGNYGTHKQVTFGSNNPPSIPTSFPILFSNTQDGAGNTLPGGIPQLLLYNGTAAQSKNQNVAQLNGSMLLLGGIILKWGQASKTGKSTVTFPVAFPNNCFAVVVTPINSAGPTVANDSVEVSNFLAASFDCTCSLRTSLTSNSVVFQYIAIGN